MKAKQQQNHYVEQHPPPSNSSTSYTSVDEEASSASSSSSESSSSIGVGVMKQQQQQQQNKQMPPVDLVLMSRLISEASSAYAAGQMAHSLALYDRLIEIDPKNNVLSANRSAILLKLGRIAEAIAEAETAIRLNPGWAKLCCQ
jgi:tetratricopeptide (TPR) repeat protein